MRCGINGEWGGGGGGGYLLLEDRNAHNNLDEVLIEKIKLMDKEFSIRHNL